MTRRPERLAAAPRAAIVLAVAVLALVLAAFTARVPAHASVEIQEVRSPSGVTAWLVEDHTLPLVTIRFAFKGGSTQDPVGKEGLANLMAGLFDEGAGDLDADAYQERLDEVGAEMRFTATRDTVFGSMRTLADTREDAFGLLALAIGRPRFDQAPIDRIRSQIVAGIEAEARDPSTRAEVAWSEAVYGDHPYARRDNGLPETLATITQSDIKAFHGRTFARDNLVVAIVGSIDAETANRELDRLFGSLPEKADMIPVSRVEPKLDQQIRVDFPLPQTRLRLAYPGVKRSDPDFMATYLMNHILGGGTFTSRLFRSVREQRGLAYGINSSLVNRDYVSELLIGTSTRSDRAAETLSVIKEEIRRMATEGPSEQELIDAKRFVIGAYAINNLDSSTAIAGTLVGIQQENLGIDYIARRQAEIEAVTLEAVKAAAARLLVFEPAVMVLGPAGPGGG